MRKLPAMLCAHMLTLCGWLQVIMSIVWNALYPTPFMILLWARESKTAWYVDCDFAPPQPVRSITPHYANPNSWLDPTHSIPSRHRSRHDVFGSDLPSLSCAIVCFVLCMNAASARAI